MKLSTLLLLPFLFLLASCDVGPSIGLINVLPNNEIIFDNNGSITDNATCTIIASPGNNGTNSTNFVTVCDDNSIHLISNGVETVLVNSKGIFSNNFDGNGENLTNVPCGSGCNGSGFWQENSTGLYYNNRNVFIGMNLTVNSLKTTSPNSISIFSGEGDRFATFSATAFNSTLLNVTRIVASLDSDLTIQNNYNGTTFMSNSNDNSHPNSSAVVSASDLLGAGMIIQKYNFNHEIPWLGRVSSFFGDIKMMTTYDDSFTRTGVNRLDFGFYQNIDVGDEFSINAYQNETIVMGMNNTDIITNRRVVMNETLYIKSDTVHPAIPGHMTFWNDGQNWFTNRSNGQTRRFILGAGGSIVLDEHLIIQNDTTLNGSLELPTLTGVGNDYLCINSVGLVFRSNTVC